VTDKVLERDKAGKPLVVAKRPPKPEPGVLVAGQRFRLQPGGPVCTVVRVTPAAAYYRGGTVREVPAFDGKCSKCKGAAKLGCTVCGSTGVEHRAAFQAQDNTVLPMSRRAFVYPE